MTGDTAKTEGAYGKKVSVPYYLINQRLVPMDGNTVILSGKKATTHLFKYD